MARRKDNKDLRNDFPDLDVPEDFVELDLDEIYTEKGLVDFSKDIYITPLGICYGLALAIATMAIQIGFELKNGTIDVANIDDKIIEMHGDQIFLTAAGLDWTVKYMNEHKFNPFLYEAALRLQ